MKLDLVLLLLVYTITNMVSVAVIFLLWRANRNRVSGLGWWLGDFSLQLLATFLLASRGVAPDFLSMVMGSTLATVGTFMLLIGIGQLLERKVPVWQNVLLILGMFLTHCYFTLIESNAVARNSNVAFALAILTGQCAWMLLRSSSLPRENGHRLAGLSLVALAVFNTLRVLFELSTASGPHRPDTEVVIGFSLLVYQTLSLLLTFGLVLIVNRRLNTTLVNELAQRERLATEMRATQSRLQLAELRSGFGHWELDLNTMVFSASDGAVAIYEYPKNQLDRDSTLLLALAEDRPRLEQAMQRLLYQGKPYNEQFRICTPTDGKIKYLHALGELDTNRQVAFGVVQDISAQKHIELALKQSEFLGDQALELARAGPWCINFSEGEEHYISSPRTIEIFGDPPRADLRYSILGHWYINIAAADPAAAEATYNNFQDAVKGVRPRYDMVHPYRRPADGTIIWVHVIGQVTRQEDGSPAHVYGVVMDITQSRNAQIELEKARNAAEIASRAKSSFLANMSHEIRTPLAAIAGMARLVRREPLTAEQTDKLNKLELATKHLSATINDILDLSKIEADQMVLEESPVLIPAIFTGIASMLQQSVEDKRLLLNLDIGPLPKDLMGDSTRLEQAFLNYASNAVKFTESGSVTLRCTLDNESADHAVLRFEVQDTGPGIAPENVSKLFTPFVQEDSTTTRKYGGTGLGLAITKRLVNAMDGEVGVVSEPGQGSTFWFTARLKKNTEVRQPEVGEVQANAAEQLKASFAGRRVLLAEDDDFNREIGTILLEDVGLLVDVAEDGQIALDKAVSNSYALILMDLQMPRMDGIEVTRQIRSANSGKNVPIVAMTANAFEEDRIRCMEAGMNDFLTKPVVPTALYQVLLDRLSNAESRAA